MFYVREDSYYEENGRLTGRSDFGESVTFEKDSSGDYYRRTDMDGRDVIEDWDGNTIAEVE